jgi:hypothetical protein
MPRFKDACSSRSYPDLDRGLTRQLPRN